MKHRAQLETADEVNGYELSRFYVRLLDLEGCSDRLNLVGIIRDLIGYWGTEEFKDAYAEAIQRAVDQGREGDD